MVLAHAVPRKGLAHEHGPTEMLKDLGKLGYHQVVLKYDGEPALRSVQEERQRRHKGPAILGNYGVGDSQANGAAERAVQSLGAKVCVLRHGLETRLGIKLEGTREGEQLLGTLGEGFFLGKRWRTGEAIVGAPKAIRRGATIRQVGAHGRWDADGLAEIRGAPWS